MAEGRFCAKCGEPFRADTKFCVSCGAPRPAAAPPMPTPDPTPEPEPIATPRIGEMHDLPTIAAMSDAPTVGNAAPTAVFAPSPPRRDAPASQSPPSSRTGDRATTATALAGAVTRPTQPRNRPRRVWLIAAVVVLLIAAGTGAFAITRRDDGKPAAAAAPSTTAATLRSTTATQPLVPPTEPNLPTESSGPTEPAGVLEPTAEVASSTRAPSGDACTPPNPTTFAASNVSDGRSDSAWMPDPSDTSPTVTLSFDTPVEVSALRLVDGYPKTDPCRPDLNRFYQYMRPTLVSVDLHDGSAPRQLAIADAPTAQTLAISGTTSQVTLTVLESDPPDPSRIETGAQTPFSIPAMSEITVMGTSAGP